MSKFTDNQYVILLTRIHYYDGVTNTFDKAQRLDKSDQENLLKSMKDTLNLFSQYYVELEVAGITIDYRVRENLTGKPLKSTFLAPALREKTKYPDKQLRKSTEKLVKFDLPLNNNYSSWGEVKVRYDSLLIVQDFKDKSKTYHIDYTDRNVKRALVDIKIDGVTRLSFEDQFNTSDLIRKINSSEYIIRNNTIILKKNSFKVETLKTIKADKKIVKNFITLDIETTVKNREHIPYCICYYDGEEKYSFYVTDFQDYDDMLNNAISSLLRSKYSGYQIYVHNLSNFDGVFLLNTLVSLVGDNIKVYPIFKDGNMINIKINFGPKLKYNISFRDSYLLLPLPLHGLAEQFQVEHAKTIFPYNFLSDKHNPSVDLNYVGFIPNVNYFGDRASAGSNFSKYLDDYLSSSSEKNKDGNTLSNWSVKKETVRYCLNDCLSLYEVLTKFNNYIFNKFRLNINTRPTLPSLTFAIFRSKYLAAVEKQGYYVPLINGKTYQDIKQSYTGGSTDMYVPKNPEGKKIFGYDVNSLYPKSMSRGIFMPVISRSEKYVTYFEGNILETEKSPFGFFNCEVKTTQKLENPILQVKHRIKTKGGGNVQRTISPLGC